MPIVVGSGPASCPPGSFIPTRCGCTEILQRNVASIGVDTTTVVIPMALGTVLDVSGAVAKSGTGAVIPTTSITYNPGTFEITVTFTGVAGFFFNLTGLKVPGDCCPFTLPVLPVGIQ